MAYHEMGAGFVNIAEMGGGFVEISESGAGFVNFPESGAGFVNLSEMGRRRSILEFGAANPCTPVSGVGSQSIGCSLPVELKSLCVNYTGSTLEQQQVINSIKAEMLAGTYTGERRQDYIDCFPELTPEMAPQLYQGVQQQTGPTGLEIADTVKDYFAELNKAATNWYTAVEGPKTTPDEGIPAGVTAFGSGLTVPNRINPIVVVGGIALVIGAAALLARR